MGMVRVKYTDDKPFMLWAIVNLGFCRHAGKGQGEGHPKMH